MGAVKDRCLGYAFSLSTMFIDKIDDVRRGVSRRLKVGRQGEAIITRAVPHTPALAVPAKELKERIAHLGRVNGEGITV